jgi:hypothetical protein
MPACMVVPVLSYAVIAANHPGLHNSATDRTPPSTSTCAHSQIGCERQATRGNTYAAVATARTHCPSVLNEGPRDHASALYPPSVPAAATQRPGGSCTHDIINYLSTCPGASLSLLQSLASSRPYLQGTSLSPSPVVKPSTLSLSGADPLALQLVARLGGNIATQLGGSAATPAPVGVAPRTVAGTPCYAPGLASCLPQSHIGANIAELARAHATLGLKPFQRHTSEAGSSMNSHNLGQGHALLAAFDPLRARYGA